MMILFSFSGPSSLPPHAAVPASEQHSQSDPNKYYDVSYLRKLYTSMSHSHTSQHWTHLPRCEFIQLAMIGDEEVRRGGPEEEIIRLAQQGKIETILSRKESIDLINLFSPQPLVVLPPPLPPDTRVLLIEGAPGGGKSTLALHICHQWSQGAFWLARFDVVVFAYLGDQAVQNAVTLADIVPAAADILKLTQASCGNILFVFDGWDEFPPGLMNNSLVSTIIRQPHKLSLHLSSVLITSRPVSSGHLLNIADQRVEILGFTQCQIREYIEKALNGNSTRIEKLVQHLEEYPVIQGYCYIPLHIAILVHVFLTLKGALPTTLRELFCSLVLCCIVREQATRKLDVNLPELTTLDDLPDDLKFKLNNLSILAYNGVMQNKVVFYSKDLRASHLPSTLPSLGLLQAVEGLTLYSKSLSYNFLHLSVQELLAANHISHMVPSEQVKVFQEFFKSSRFQAVLQYYCGFTKLDNPEIHAFISSFQTGIASFKDLLPLLHCFFEAQQPSLCQLVDPRFIPNEQEILNSRDLTPVDFLVVGYFITSLLSTSTANNIHLTVNRIDDHCLKMLLSELSKSDGADLSLGLYSPSITEQGVSHIASHLKKSSAVKELLLSNGNMDSGTGFLMIAEVLLTNSSLTSLSLPCMGLHLTKEYCSVLTKLLQTNQSLRYLDLSSNSILDSSFFEGLQRNTNLVKLNLSNTGITAARSLTTLLRVNKSLTYLDLSSNLTSDSGARCIFEGLQHNTTLVNLNLSHTGIPIADPDTARSLTKMLQVNKSLTHLDLSRNHTLSDSGARYIFVGLQHNTTLVNSKSKAKHVGIITVCIKCL